MRKLLIVDDSPNLRRLLARLVERSGLRPAGVVEAGSGREALAMLTADPDIDMVLTDGHMPEMDGAQLVRAVRDGQSGRPNVLLVVIETEGGADMAERAMEAGADACLRKPFRPEDLRAMWSGGHSEAA